MYQNCKSEDALRLLTEIYREYSLGQYFQLWEMQCHDGTDVVFVHPALILLLNDMRRHFGVSVNINSGYRTETYNEKVGGGTNSYHKLGMAADVSVVNALPEEVAKWAEASKAGGVGRYDTFTHIDVGPPRGWDNR